MWRASIRFFVQRFFRRKQLERDLDEEVRSHLAIEMNQRIERGERPESAQDGARRDFGNTALIQETARDMWGFAGLEQMLRDVRFAFRTLSHAPLFAIIVVLALALGIGGASA